jgi:hypothetical protein
MARSAPGRLATGLLLLVAAATWLGGTPAAAAPKPPAPNAITIAGTGLPKPVTVRADASPSVFTALLDQVAWLTGAGHRASPANVDLGPKYTVTVLVNNKPSRTFDLYPLASGGPRAFRPAKQPGGRSVAAAWFFGRLTMPEALQAAGVPLPERAGAGGGGAGGGARIVPEPVDESDQGVAGLVGQLRRVLLVTVVVILMITALLGASALFVRRRTR